uniref:Uncharacterized protein n=1 Tax=Candidatus Kentrum sp. MB TaxID=2138164 RepID=A0A451BC76_9GAMM|nr:MAG: hypothetical protein BECKMB1821I_GA0114274_102519 [Candidatus Kentron sp. MB]VFK75878.1 MAG: hypothetical protein BECKMB1821H_GA0114242_103419 [Candidatus Kentron sp. MB]
MSSEHILNAARLMAAFPDMDCKRLLAQVLQKKEQEMMLLKMECEARESKIKYRMQKEHTNDLKNLFNALQSRDIKISVEGGKAVTNDRTQTITNSTIIGSTVNQGEIRERINNIVQNIGALPVVDADTENQLKGLVAQLTEALKDVPEKDANAMLTATERAVEDAGKNPSLLGGTLESLKQATLALKSHPMVAKIVSEIVKILGSGAVGG